MEPFPFPIRQGGDPALPGGTRAASEDSLLEKLNLARERIRRVSRPLYTYRIFPLSRTETGLFPKGQASSFQVKTSQTTWPDVTRWR